MSRISDVSPVTHPAFARASRYSLNIRASRLLWNAKFFSTFQFYWNKKPIAAKASQGISPSSKFLAQCFI